MVAIPNATSPMRCSLSQALVVLLVAIGPCVDGDEASPPSDRITPLQGRLLIDVLEDYRAAGYDFVYSDELVRGDLRLTRGSRNRDPIARLRESLQHERLALRKSQTERLFRIVRSQRQALQLFGRVTDASTGRPLPGARVDAGDATTSTDREGRFHLTPSYLADVSVSGEGYVGVTLPVASPVRSLPDIALQPRNRVDEVLIVIDRDGAVGGHDPIERDVVDASELTIMPVLGDDPLRATNRLTGASTVGLSAMPHVRGGLRDETVVLFNGIRLLEPFHLKDFQGVFSGLDRHAVKTVDVYTGGFPARYGGSLSGVVDVKPADTRAGPRAELAMSVLNASAFVRGNLADRQAAWALSMRRGNLDILTRQVNPNLGTPSYDDAYGRVSWEFGADSEVDLGAIVYNDDIEFMEGDDDIEEYVRSRYRNGYWWARLRRDWTPGLMTETSLSFGAIRHARDGFLLADDEPDESTGAVDDERRFEIWSFAHRLTFRSDDWSGDIGLGIESQRGRYDYRAHARRGALAGILGVAEFVEHDLRLRPRRVDGNAYASARYRPTQSISIQAGLRWDRQDFAEAGSAQQLSPRLAVLFAPGARTVLRLAVGTFSQAEGIHELPIADGADSFQSAQRAQHIVAGIRHRFGTTGLDLRVEAFHKRYSKTKRRFENLFNPFVLLPELSPDRMEIWPTAARAEGLEVTLRYRRDAQLHGWLGYARSSARDLLGGRWMPRRWDQADSLSAGVTWNGGAWSASAALLWHTGWRTTQLPNTIREGEKPVLDFNAGRLPNFASFDVRFTRTWHWSSQSLAVFVQASNVLSRKNVGGVEYELEEDPGIGGFQLSAEPETTLPLVPSVGVRWQFR